MNGPCAAPALRQRGAFEVVVAADARGLAALDAAGLGKAVKRVPFDAANLSAARNRGVTVSAGEVVVFIDDDAVPEPTWLGQLAAPFGDASVGAAGGFVRGRNGFSFQWRASVADTCGRRREIAVHPARPTLLQGDAGRAIRTEGTNCAFRRIALLEMGGFDEAIHFYLDETDLNLRLGAAGWATAILPMAQVQHGFLAGPLRRADRVPRDLFETGASLAYFGRRHGAPPDRAAALDEARAEQRRRLLAHVIEGRIEPREMRRLLARFDAGLAAGEVRQGPVLPLTAAMPSPPPLLPFPALGPGARGVLMVARPLYWRRARAEARARAAAGEIVTLMALSHTPRPQRIRFLAEGYWAPAPRQPASPVCGPWTRSL
ncbi:MAG: glycosyl transferase [Alphaproteobacteria bacterium HGW-Alphaproteobacteria-2]|nr:MAG: glycosyl transferase [Alphaproteobacteria bacterium HGW-Alphaproteobacteria-2]